MGIKTVIIVHYGLNIKEITEKYCVNKDKPMLHCNGKCHLAKQLKAATDEKNSNDAMSLLSWLDPIQLLYQQKKIAVKFCFSAENRRPHFLLFQFNLHKGFGDTPYVPPISIL